MERIPDESQAQWRDVITRTTEHQFDSLALRILLGRLNVKVRFADSADAMNKSVRELRNFFEKSSKTPSTQRDLAKIFSKRVRA